MTTSKDGNQGKKLYPTFAARDIEGPFRMSNAISIEESMLNLVDGIVPKDPRDALKYIRQTIDSYKNPYHD